ncbi:MAG: hypothetical protein RL139_168 [Gemmatimonadota bacterium]|jgi:rhodanese-related sulfurtransferase
MAWLDVLKQLLPSTFGPADLEALRAAQDRTVLLDVREPDEFADGHIAGSVLLPVGKVPHHAATIAGAGVPVVVICRSGARASSSAGLLRQAGATSVQVLAGGVLAWAREGRALERGSRSPALVAALKGRR